MFTRESILEKLNVDGIIVADGGVVDIVREYAPNTEIHISTQANTVSYHTCKFWHRNGAKSIILGRELNKEQIKEIMKNKPEDLDIEMFAHGALCFGYSGRCFLSEFLSGRSGNLGSCSQPCRWAFNLYVEETNNPGNLMPVETDEKGTYIFSSKDLCLIREIPEIIDMGIDSLKIEGRLKTEYYLASVINVYRNAIDDYEKAPENWNFEKYFKLFLHSLKSNVSSSISSVPAQCESSEQISESSIFIEDNLSRTGSTAG